MSVCFNLVAHDKSCSSLDLLPPLKIPDFRSRLCVRFVFKVLFHHYLVTRRVDTGRNKVETGHQ
jgi:hypothetical protein